ncbi:MAG: Rpn family recombination-promoting nuclease/putative transposase [Butyrivibrio sp.]|nr:Rpn family recombination-promoting nuclease/putative transposase [Butyrivibrio sp.]
MSQQTTTTEEHFYPLTNDVMFHAVFNSNKVALKGLVCSVLHLDESEVTDIQVLSENEPPIYAGGKSYRLDIVLTLNNSSHINIEMQVDRDDWTNRSLAYLCRSYDHINRGQSYGELQPAIHIGFLDFTLFDNHPKFHSTYMLRDIDDGYTYSDNFVLKVVELNQTDNASPEDIKFGVDRWARLFKATSREELFMIAQDNTSMIEAANTAKLMYEDERIREAIILEEERQAAIRRYENKINTLSAENDSLSAEIKRLKKELEEAKKK